MANASHFAGILPFALVIKVSDIIAKQVLVCPRGCLVLTSTAELSIGRSAGLPLCACPLWLSSWTFCLGGAAERAPKPLAASWLSGAGFGLGKRSWLVKQYNHRTLLWPDAAGDSRKPIKMHGKDQL